MHDQPPTVSGSRCDTYDKLPRIPRSRYDHLSYDVLSGRPAIARHLVERPIGMHFLPDPAATDQMGASATVRKALRSALPALSQPTWVILDALVTNGASPASARAAARRLGLRNRFALARRLRADGLPPPRELAGLIQMLLWVSAYQERPVSLFRLAMRDHKAPAVCYRTVKRLTGLRWTDVRARGVGWVLYAMLGRCRTVKGARLVR